MRTVPVILMILSLSTVDAQKPVKFSDEFIDFEVNSRYFVVNGLYYFVNSTNEKIKKKILFPFSVSMDSIRNIRIFNITYSRRVPYKLRSKNISFSMVLKPLDTVCLNISYKQVVQKKNTYILQTTQTWGKPLQKANYTLTVKDSLFVNQFSYKPDSISGNQYFWKKRKFFPKKDFTFQIKSFENPSEKRD
jgi:hypothetical protein